MASPATMGTLLNVVVPKAGVERDGFTQMSGDVERFQVGAVYRLTLTEDLPPGWESIREEQKEGFLGLACCVRAELLERRNY